MKQLAANGKEMTGRDIRDTLHQIKVMGATGLNQFDMNGDTVGKQFTTKTVENGSVVSIESR
jgi:ABC-type branched-subunit amino acid transport system substrate-binding protein